MRLSLRVQLSLWFALAMAVIMVVSTFVAQQATVWNIERSLDDALEKRANMVAAIISSDFTTDEANYYQVMSDLTTQGFHFVPLLLRIISPTGRTIVEFGKVADPIVANLDTLLASAGLVNGRFDSITIEGIEPLRAYTVSVSHPRTHQALATVQAVEALGPVAQARDRLWRNGLSVALIAGLLAIATGLIIIGRGFRPMRGILKTIDEVDYDHLKASLKKGSRPAELEELARSLNAMWQRLDSAVSEKQKAIGSISHDLRTPLTALQGQLEVMLLQPSLSAEVKDSLERMLSETRRLIRMVKDLLLSVQLESRPVLTMAEVDLGSLLDEVVADIWVLARERELSVHAPRDVVVRGDRDLLKQMTLNIVDNALKFTSKGGRVELSVSREGDHALLGVTDNGPGIAADQLPHVTEAFYKPDASRRPPGQGARLGLAIVKQITELHGGLLQVQSESGAGTSVRVSLPLAA